jgi:hypothetical protein
MCKFHIDTLKKLSFAGRIRMHTFGFLVGLFSFFANFPERGYMTTS